MLDALVVGGGPVGLVMASELHRRGLRCRVIDKNAAPSALSKAIGLQARTLEVMADLGIVDEAVARGRVVRGVNVYADGERITQARFDDLDSPYPFVLSLPQSDTEQILLRRLGEQELTVERNAALTTLEQDPEGVTATVAHADGDEAVRARWLIGCDGAHSTVRKALGLEFAGHPYEEQFLLADVTVDGALAPDETHLHLSAGGFFLVLPLPGERRFRVVMDLDEKRDQASLADVQAVAARRLPPSLTLSDSGWVAPFRVQRRIVPSFRDRRVFLAGDAAHIHSPVGGQGMNTGIQDAYNLAWKLQLVTRGAARPELLDSYSAERQPIAAATLRNTDLATRMLTLKNPLGRELRNRVAALLGGFEMVQERIADTFSELSLAYRDSPIVAQHRAPLSAVTLEADRTTERPSVRDCLDFERAPNAGERAPDVQLAGGDGQAARRLFSVLHGELHTLLLFDGGAPTAAGYAHLDAIGRAVRERWGQWIRVRLVIRGGERPTGFLHDETVLLDGDGAAHRRYGAGAECLYLVRPDGYVGYRCQPADGDKLTAYLQTIFV